MPQNLLSFLVYVTMDLNLHFYATHSGDPIDYHWTNRVSYRLLDLGEYEKAIEWYFYIVKMYKDNEVNKNVKNVF